MKKVLIFVAGLIVLVLIALITIPILFKDDIQAALDAEVAKSIDAQVFYNTDAFSLSLIKDFPNLTVSIGEFGIAGNAPFEMDTLISVGEFRLTLNLMSVIGGSQIKIVNVLLDNPAINVRILANGQANYDIAKATSSETEVEKTNDAEESAPLSIDIQSWEIRNGNMVYADATLPMSVAISNLNHSGSGDFAQNVFDMITNTTAESFSLSYDGVKYINQKPLAIDLIMGMDLANMKFTFKENRAALSAFGFGFDGFISMPDDNIDIDITYEGKDIDLKGVLSLIPGDYQEYLTGVTASGVVSFDGFVKGVYNESNMPQVTANLNVDNGSIKYAEYPVPMEDIIIRSTFDYPSADLKETSFVMDQFSMSLDGESVTAGLIFKDLEDYFWDFKLDGNIDLGKMTQIFPLDSMELTGKINSKLRTMGRMSDLEAENYEALSTSGSMSISNFAFASPDLPQGFGISSSSMTFDPNEITLDSFQGNAGETDLNMSGQITDYMQFALNDATLFGRLDFSSQQVLVDEWMALEDTTATQSQPNDEAETEELDTTEVEVVRIPENVDFVLASTIDLIKYDNLDLEDFEGEVVIRDGALNLNKVNFNLLDGYFEMNGSFETASELPLPLYSFDFKIQDLSIPRSFQAFNTVQKMAPMAEKMRGKFSSGLEVNGVLDANMTPVYEEMQGLGNVLVTEGSLDDVKLLQAASKFTKLSAEDGSVKLNDVNIDLEIVDGKIFVEPFDIVLGGRKATISGSTAVDGNMDYQIVTNVPTGKVGEAANSLVSQFTGGTSLLSESLDVVLGVTGTYDDYQVKLVSAKPGGSGEDAGAKAAAKAKLEAAKKKAEAELAKKKAEAERIAKEKKEEAEREAKAKAAELKKKAEEEAKKAAEEAAKKALGDEAKDAVKNLFGKKKKSGGI